MKKLFLLSFLLLLSACGEQKADTKPQVKSKTDIMAEDSELANRIIGIWESSEKSYKDAETSDKYVDVKKDGTLRFFKLENGEEKTLMQLTWKIEKGKLLIFKGEKQSISAEIHFLDDNHMTWINQDDETLYLILGAG